ncbi:MAG: AMP-binding protein [Gammaproteobacteria bacterium]|nr:AMP-binding protein [Gammaproteobacteria bacterium]NIR83445.1 AMP-binding protein [Gammaproteobacteria bacterium]NIR91367.1 AMP-binding protein [Gammaproteobacteria bacterium]NIU04607.1 AMP-binding protein [Gammaproteobacteria bacterium]NIV51649.1 AMP-binding protein [Gammaproteobacteria bacterium]
MSAATPEKRQQKAPIDPEALLETVRNLVVELYPHKRGQVHVSLDTSLDRDLGLDSLARMELLQRVERDFAVTVPEHAAATAETPRDLLHAASAEIEAAPAEGPSLREVPHEAVESTPERTGTLLEALDWHVQRHAERVHIHLYSDDHRRVEPITHGALRAQAAKVAAGLRARDLDPGRAVAIMLPTEPQYFYCFIGVMLAGGIPVPMYPPARLSQLEEHVRRHAGILANAQVDILVTFPQAKPVARLLKAQVPSLRSIETVADLCEHGTFEGPALATSESIAFLQYTSGSTGSPKGVVLTHGNVLANIRAMGETVQASSTDVFVSWLPLYHDMGLIGAWLGSLCYGFPLVLLPPLSFLHRPARWLWAIHRHRGTLSGAPNFAYELCLRRLSERDLEGLDLSSWRLAFNGAEPVSPETINGFAQRFAGYGLRREAIAPVYGLAEATLGVCFTPIERGPRIDRVKRDVLAREGRAVRASADEPESNVLQWVSCGEPLRGFQVRIVDDAGREVGDREEGHLEFKGPGTTSGYYRNPEATRALFHDDWLVSGDRAYIAEGEIYLTTRTKDVIIRAGRNIYPYEFEERVGDLEGVRKGCVAVFGSQDPYSRTERLVVLAETRETDPHTHERIKREINQLATDLIGAAPDDVVLVPPRTVLKTSSGKIRRSAMRELYEHGKVSARARSVWLQFLRLAWAGAMPQLRRVRRAVLNVLYAGYVWALFVVLAPSAWVALALTPGRERRWRTLGRFGRTLFRLAAVPVRVTGLEHVPKDTPYVLAANHSSYLDGLVITSVLPHPVGYVAKRELLDSFIPRIFLRRLGALFVERFDRRRSVEDSREVSHTLLEGRSLAYFPEGTFIRSPGLLPFRLGAFVASVQAGVPVLPVAIRGTRSILRSGSSFPRRGAIRVTIGAPVAPAPSGEGDEWHAVLRLRDRVRAAILQHSGEPDLEHHGLVRPD